MDFHPSAYVAQFPLEEMYGLIYIQIFLNMQIFQLEQDFKVMYNDQEDNLFQKWPTVARHIVSFAKQRRELKIVIILKDKCYLVKEGTPF